MWTQNVDHNQRTTIKVLGHEQRWQKSPDGFHRVGMLTLNFMDAGVSDSPFVQQEWSKTLRC